MPIEGSIQELKAIQDLKRKIIPKYSQSKFTEYAKIGVHGNDLQVYIFYQEDRPGNRLLLCSRTDKKSTIWNSDLEDCIDGIFSQDEKELVEEELVKIEDLDATKQVEALISQFIARLIIN